MTTLSYRYSMGAEVDTARVLMAGSRRVPEKQRDIDGGGGVGMMDGRGGVFQYR